MQKKWIDGVSAVGKRHGWAVDKWCGGLPAGLRSGAGRRILASALAVCMVFTLLPSNAFAAEGNNPNGLACHTVHDKDCGYSETYKAGGCTHEHDGECGYDEGSEGAPCTYTPNEGETDPHEHNDDCGYKAAVPGKNCTHEHDGECGYAETVTVTSPCTHKCALCEGNNSGKPEQCVCTVLCTGETVDADCPVCGGEKAGLSLCKGKAEVVPDATSEAAQAVIDLIDALPSADEIYDGAVGDSDSGYADWLVDTQETLRGAQAAQAAFDALDDEDKAAVGELRTDKLAELVNLSAMLTQLQPQSDVPVPTVGFGRIYANGTALLFEAGTTDGNTVIYIDNNRDGIKNEGDTIFTEGLAGKDENGNDLSSHTIYGGSDTAELTGDTKITTTGGKVKNIYGGGYAGGGYANATVTGSTSVTVNGGTVGSVYGGGYAGGGYVNVTVTGSTSVTVNGGTVGSVYGGGYANANANVSGSTNVTVKGGTVSNSVYGGGYAGNDGTANVGVSTSVTIDGTATVGENVYGGGYAGGYASGGFAANATVTGSTSVTVSGGKVGTIYGGGNADGNTNTNANVTGSTNVTVSGSTVGTIYGGGSAGGGTANVGSRTLTIGGGAKIGSDNDGVIINGGSETNGVDSFAIDPDLTEEASISVVLPVGYDVSGKPAIATGAVQGDLARIKLVGSGAAGNMTYFEGDDIKVGTPPTVTNVAVSPITVKVTKGTTQQFDATVTGTNGPMQSVTWAIEGSHDSDTSISQSGLLTVAANETQKTLTVKATSTADTTKSGTATVTVIDREVTRYTLTVTDGSGSGEYAEGAQITITARTKTGKRFNNWTATGMTLGNAAANPITITMPARAVTLTANYEDIPAGNYTITFNVNGGNALTTSTAQTGADGRLQRLPAPTRSGSYRFDGWFTAETGGTAVTTATVFTQNSTIYAHWTYTGGSGSSDGGGGSSSSNNNSSVVTTEPSKPTPDNPNPPTTGTVKPAVTVDKNGTVKVEVSDKDIQNAIDNALTQTKKDSTQSNGIAVAIGMTGLQTQFNTLPLTLSKTAYDKLVKAGVKSLDIRTAQISLSLDLATLQTIHAAANGDVTIEAVKADPADLPEDLSRRPAYNLTITSGGKAISSFGGYVTITLPYALQAGEQGGNLQMAYVGTGGKLNTITDSSYNTDAKALIGRTNHFTVFGIVSSAAPAFSDIENNWAKDDILFVASRELLSGIGDNQFSPNTAMPRGTFVTALGRLAGVNPDSYKTGKFTDVKADADYAPYVNWAADKGIVNGTTDTTFAPDANISREQMAVMIANYAKTMGYTITKTREAVTFADNDSIGGWAKDAVAAMQMVGVVNGKGGNRFDPKGAATRAEVAAVLHRFWRWSSTRRRRRGWTPTTAVRP